MFVTPWKLLVSTIGKQISSGPSSPSHVVNFFEADCQVPIEISDSSRLVDILRAFDRCNPFLKPSNSFLKRACSDWMCWFLKLPTLWFMGSFMKCYGESLSFFPRKLATQLVIMIVMNLTTKSQSKLNRLKRRLLNRVVFPQLFPTLLIKVKGTMLVVKSFAMRISPNPHLLPLVVKMLIHLRIRFGFLFMTIRALWRFLGRRVFPMIRQTQESVFIATWPSRDQLCRWV